MPFYNISDTPEPGIEGLDELAETLGVEAGSGQDGIALEGRSGKRYGFVELLAAHTKLMRESLVPTT
jgi:hypothetical protein